MLLRLISLAIHGGSDNFFHRGRGRGTTEDPLDFIQLALPAVLLCSTAAVKNPDPHSP
jgi:hypothetical protein